MFGGTEIWVPEWLSLFWDAARYEAFVEKLGPWAPAFAIAAMIIVSFLPLPAETVAIANGMAFGQWTGFVLTWIGAVIAAAIAFCIARALGQPLVRRMIPARHLDRYEALGDGGGAAFLLIVRLIPLIPYTVVNYGAGLSLVRFRTFLWTSAVGMAAPIFAFVSAGALMREQPWLGWLGVFAAVALFALLGRAFYRRIAPGPAA
ncbi:MAG: VTT domain-containing protein [Pseudomonadota bacterium]